MSRQWQRFAPAQVDLVGWTGDVSQLAARLHMDEAALESRLRNLARGKSTSQLTVEAPPANDRAIMAALLRLLAGENIA